MAILRRLVRLVVILLTGIFFNAGVSILALLVPGRRRPRFRARGQQLGCQWLCTVLGLRVRIEGELPPAGSGMLVSNHFGALEPLALAANLPGAFVAKVEIASWPLIGWITRTMGVIFVERGRPDRKGHFLGQVEDRLEAGVVVFAFPEGTTTEGDKLLPFKSGVFEAVRGGKQAAIYPCFTFVEEEGGRPATLDDQRGVSWAGGKRPFLRYAWHLLGLRRPVLRMRMGAPIEPNGHDRKTLARKARAAVLSLAEGYLPGPSQTQQERQSA